MVFEASVRDFCHGTVYTKRMISNCSTNQAQNYFNAKDYFQIHVTMNKKIAAFIRLKIHKRFKGACL